MTHPRTVRVVVEFVTTYEPEHVNERLVGVLDGDDGYPFGPLGRLLKFSRVVSVEEPKRKRKGDGK